LLHTIYAIEQVVADSDNTKQHNWISHRHQQSSVSEWPKNVHHVLDHGLFIRGCEEWPVINSFSILEPLAGEFSESVG
jgi:hypothetical protein